MQIKVTHKINHSQYDLTNIQVLLENNITYQNQALSSEKLQGLLLRLKLKKRKIIVGFIASKYKKCLYIAKTVAYQVQVGQGEVLSRHRYKETRILPINTIAFS